MNFARLFGRPLTRDEKLRRIADKLQEEYFCTTDGGTAHGRIKILHDAYERLGQSERDFSVILNDLLEEHGEKEMISAISYFWSNDENLSVNSYVKLLSTYDDSVGVSANMDYFLKEVRYGPFWGYVARNLPETIENMEFGMLPDFLYKASKNGAMSRAFKEKLDSILDICWKITATRECNRDYDCHNCYDPECKLNQDESVTFGSMLQLLCDYFPNLQSEILGHAYCTFLAEREGTNIDFCILLDAIADYEKVELNKYFTSDLAATMYILGNEDKFPWAKNILEDVEQVFEVLLPTDDISGIIWIYQNRLGVKEELLSDCAFAMACRIFDRDDLTIPDDIIEILKTKEGFELFPYYFKQLMRNYAFGETLKFAEEHFVSIEDATR